MHTAHRARTAPVLLLVIALSGCGGGGGAHSALPAAPIGGVATSSPAPSTSSTKTAPAQFAIRIPAASAGASASRRSPAYIAASTQSITVAVVGGSASTSATINVGSSSCTSSSGTQVCTATVQAPIGSDTFTVTTYDAANGTGNVLATGTVTATIVAYQANVVPLTLGGTIASLAVSVDTPYLPAIDGGTANATVVAKDASGSQIIGTYATAVSLTAAAGLTLSSSTIADSGHATVPLTYNGVARTALAITASSGSVSGQGSVVPTSHVHVTKGGVPAGTMSSPFVMIPGPDGAMYFGDNGATSSLQGSIVTPTNPGAVGRFDPSTGQITEIALKGINPIGMIFVGNDLYVAEMNTGSIGKITNAGAGGFAESNYAQLLLPNAPPSGTISPGTAYDGPRMFAYVSASKTLYVTCNTSSQVAAIDLTLPWGTQTAMSGVRYIPTPSVGLGYPRYQLEFPDGIALGGDGNLYVTENTRYSYVYTDPIVSKLVPGATSMTDIPIPVGIDGGDTVARFDAKGADGNLYITEITNGNVPAPIIKYDGSNFSIVSSLTGTANLPDFIQPGPGTTLTTGALLTGSGVNVYDTASGKTQIYPVYAYTADPASTFYAQTAVDGGNGNYYFTFDIGSGGVALSDVEVGTVALAQGWQLLPEETPVIDGTNISQAILGVAELPTQHDTVVVASTTPSVCSVTTPSGFTNTYVVAGVGAGTCTITATDENGRVVTKSMQVTSNSLTVTSHNRSAR